MTLSEALYARLAAWAPFAALITDASYGLRLYPRQAPQNAPYPLVVYARIGRVGVRSLNGPSGLAMRRIQIDSWAKSLPDAQATALTIQTALDGWDADPVADCELVNEHDDYEPGAEPKLYRVMQDYIFTVKE